ncbi:hypothetical protein [Nonomuraea salmonea]|uniref:hypothetical protein n=1 Tax=Nonomuraea salmonea TaxID=46181 RepID=UPI002FEB0E76
MGEAVAAAAEAVELYAGAPPYEDAVGQAEALFGLGGVPAAGRRGGRGDQAREGGGDPLPSPRRGRPPRYAGPAARAQYNVACALLESGRLEEAVTAFEGAGGHPGFASHLTTLLTLAKTGTSTGPQPSPTWNAHAGPGGLATPGTSGMTHADSERAFTGSGGSAPGGAGESRAVRGGLMGGRCGRVCQGRFGRPRGSRAGRISGDRRGWACRGRGG